MEPLTATALSFAVSAMLLSIVIGVCVQTKRKGTDTAGVKMRRSRSLPATPNGIQLAKTASEEHPHPEESDDDFIIEEETEEDENRRQSLAGSSVVNPQLVEDADVKIVFTIDEAEELKGVSVVDEDVDDHGYTKSKEGLYARVPPKSTRRLSVPLRREHRGVPALPERRYTTDDVWSMLSPLTIGDNPDIEDDLEELRRIALGDRGARDDGTLEEDEDRMDTLRTILGRYSPDETSTDIANDHHDGDLPLSPATLGTAEIAYNAVGVLNKPSVYNASNSMSDTTASQVVLAQDRASGNSNDPGQIVFNAPGRSNSYTNAVFQLELKQETFV